MPINPMQLIQMIRSGKNPQELVMSILEESAQQNPLYANLMSLAKENKTAEIEAIARNIFKEKGLDFDKEFNNFKSKMGL